jgi:hypothetical protein
MRKKKGKISAKRLIRRPDKDKKTCGAMGVRKF